MSSLQKQQSNKEASRTRPDNGNERKRRAVRKKDVLYLKKRTRTRTRSSQAEVIVLRKQPASRHVSRAHFLMQMQAEHGLPSYHLIYCSAKTKSLHLIIWPSLYDTLLLPFNYVTSVSVQIKKKEENLYILSFRNIFDNDTEVED